MELRTGASDWGLFRGKSTDILIIQVKRLRSKGGGRTRAVRTVDGQRGLFLVCCQFTNCTDFSKRSTINEFLMAQNCFSVGVFDLRSFDFF